MKLFIGVDDTDNETSMGTGKFARLLASTLQKQGYGKCTGVTRHQLLFDPRIPYTSHNSAAALVLEDNRIEEVARACRKFLRANFHQGSDPGLCIATRDAFKLEQFGRYAQNTVLTKEIAYSMAKQTDCILEEHGGTGDGIIGALAAVGLRAGENDGRFLDLGGSRSIEGIVSARELLTVSGADKISALSGESILGSELIDTKSRVRPELREGKAIIFVERNEGQWQIFRKTQEYGPSEE